MNTSDFLSISAAICPERDFLVFEGQRLNYEQIGDRVNRLAFALDALGIEKGDEVITTPFTFFATIEAIIYEEAIPVFVDIDPKTFNIDVSRIEAAITSKTKAILPVHMFGLPADMTAIMKIANKHNLYVIEDCAQSFGATLNSKQTGSFGDAGCFSFYPSKNLGACGDGGIITMNNAELTEDLKKFRNHGSAGSYIHQDIGRNSRLDAVQAAILLIKLKRIDDYNNRRRKSAAMYNELLGDIVQCPVEPDGYNHVYHQYTIRHPERDRIKQVLADNEISSNVYYPIPTHLQPAMADFGMKPGSMPLTEKASNEVLSLPMCPELAASSIELIAKTIKESV